MAVNPHASEKKLTPLEEKLVLYQKHFSTAALPDRLKSNLGKYYTPPHLVDLVTELVRPYVKTNSVILDLAAGCGAFLDAFPNNSAIIRDIDLDAVSFLHSVGYTKAEQDNSLFNVSRYKLGLSLQDHLVCIGNPPYNDITSLVKRQGENAKQAVDFYIDHDIRSNDLGTSFLRAFNKLHAEVICILHPLSYLIKESNFNNRLKNFTYEYVLNKGVIFSSNEFTDMKGTPFPIVAALYLRDFRGMDYEFIREFQFGILNSSEIFVLSDYPTTDGYIQKYAPSYSGKTTSEISLYMHNFRDLNSLKAVGNLSDKPLERVTIPVSSKNLYKYAYLNALRRYFPKDFRWGNLSPLVSKEQLETDVYLRDVCLIDTIMNNQRLSCFARSPQSELIKKFSREFETKSVPPGFIDIYRIFSDFIRGELDKSKELEHFLSDYFIKLPEKLKNSCSTTKISEISKQY